MDALVIHLYKIVQIVLTGCNKLDSSLNKVESSFCNACCKGKVHNLPYLPSKTIYTKPLELIHLSLWALEPMVSTNWYRYYIHFVDHFSGFTWIYMLHNKSKAFTTFQNFKARVDLQLGHEMDFRSKGSIFLSYSINHKGYKCLATNGKISISRKLLVNEALFPYCDIFNFHTTHTHKNNHTTPSHITLLDTSPRNTQTST